MVAGTSRPYGSGDERRARGGSGSVPTGVLLSALGSSSMVIMALPGFGFVYVDCCVGHSSDMARPGRRRIAPAMSLLGARPGRSLVEDLGDVLVGLVGQRLRVAALRDLREQVLEGAVTLDERPVGGRRGQLGVAGGGDGGLGVLVRAELGRER